MAYFPNGTSGEIFQNRQCSKCVHGQSADCAVWTAHLLHNYEKDKRPVLDILIPMDADGIYPLDCEMFIASDLYR